MTDSNSTYWNKVYVTGGNDIYWSEIFKNITKNKASRENKGAICLYWYLLNKKDHPTHIQEEFKKYNINNDFPKGLEDNHHFNKSGWELLKSRSLIELDHEKLGKHGRVKYYKVNPAFLCLPFYNKQAIKDKSYEDMTERYRFRPEHRYSNEFDALWTSFYPDSYKKGEWLSISLVSDLLDFVQKIKRDPKDFLKPLATLKKLNYISLWILIQRMFYELYLYIKSDVLEFRYPSFPFNEILELSRGNTIKEAKEKIERYYKGGGHEIYDPNPYIKESLKRFKIFKTDWEWKYCDRVSKQTLEKEAILDLKKINTLSKNEIPEKLDIRIKELFEYLNFLIRAYSYYESGILTGTPFYIHDFLAMGLPKRE